MGTGVYGGAERVCPQWSSNRLFMWLPPGERLTSLWDAIECGIETAARDTETPQRRVLVLTDGSENIDPIASDFCWTPPDDLAKRLCGGTLASAALSRATPDSLAQLARRLEIGVHAVAMPPTQNGLARGDKFDPDGQLRSLAVEPAVHTTRYKIRSRWRPPSPASPLNCGASTLLSASLSNALSLERPKLVLSVRRSDVLVTWHLVETAPAPAPPGPSAEVSAPERTLPLKWDQRLTMYSSDGRLAVPSGGSLLLLARDLRSAAPAWIRSGEPDKEGRRRALVAAFALDLIQRQPDASAIPFGSLFDFVDWAGDLVHNSGSEQAERLWYLASVGVLQRYGSTAAPEGPVVQVAGSGPAAGPHRALYAGGPNVSSFGSGRATSTRRSGSVDARAGRNRRMVHLAGKPRARPGRLYSDGARQSPLLPV